MHDDNCFITCTYSPEFLPADESLDKRHFQLFMKRFRKRFGQVRYFQCGEYGEQLSRPHYHACIFGFRFPDRVLLKENDGQRLWTSKSLEELWGMGFCTVGELTFESAAYVARYVMKKVTGEAAEDYYKKYRLDGQLVDVQPEYVCMSRRPGIARAWFERWNHDVFPADEVIARGFAGRPPRFYDKLLEAESPVVFEEVKKKRRKEIEKYSDNCTPERLKVRRKVTEARVKQLRRVL